MYIVMNCVENSPGYSYQAGNVCCKQPAGVNKHRKMAFKTIMCYLHFWSN